MTTSTYSRSAALATLLAGLAAGPALAQSSAFVLRGAIRDFTAEHPDFGPGLPTGHFPGSLEFTAGPDGDAIYAGKDYEAVTQWRDRLGRPIAPHLWNEGRVFVEVATAPSLAGSSTRDSYDSELGPYDWKTAGPEPEWLVGSPMPTITEPELDVAYSGDFIRSSSGTTVLDSDVHCELFQITDFHTLRVEGNRKVLVEGDFLMRDSATLELAPGATIDFYVKGAMGTYDTVVGGAQHTHRVRFYNLGTSEFRVGDKSQVSAHYFGPTGPLTLADSSHFYGRVTAQSVTVPNKSGLHIDDNLSVCSIAIEDSRGSAGSAGAGITSAATFAQWFDDVMGVNASKSHSMVMRDSSGMFQHSDDAFFPIDQKMYGNQGDPHNYYFTFDARATFTYNACAPQGQLIQFEGSDDCWIFINDQLIIDLGGVEAGTPQVCELDRLRLVDGETYSFRLLYAHRRPGPARFNLQTNFELAPADVVSGIAAYPAHD